MAKFDKHTTAEEVSKLFADEIRGKTILITGVTKGGLGAEAALALSLSHPKLLILAGRSLDKLLAVEKEINSISPNVVTRRLLLDLSSLEKVRKAAAEVDTYAEPIDRLINNAGIMAAPYSTTEDGIESQFGTNYVGPFLFTNLIMGRILAAGEGARIVNVSSDGHSIQQIRFEDYNFGNGETYNKWKAYGQAKTGNILFSVALAEKVGGKGVRAYSLHPGMIMTNLGRYITKGEMKNFGWLDESGNVNEGLWKSIQEGAATHVVAAFDPSISDQNGAYLQDCKVDMEACKPYAKDKNEAERLWKLSESLVGQEFSY
ncbi:MAG: hypothetical protein M1834_002478 [Cirrosporium novae-zelandiae]|nr:MAG: hypothetical protein M1834_002478 [Cirrosporium novae-zelandiae]